MKIFIDANKYLDLFRAYKDANRLEIIKFLNEKKKKGVFEIVVTDQVLDEFYRNEYQLRKIQVVIPSLALQIPSFLQNIPEVKKVIKIKKSIEELAQKIQEKYIERLTNHNSKINKKVESILSKALKIEASPDILEKAQYRIIKGNPPDKTGNCIGDAISWETLLTFCSDDDLIIVTRDSDFFDKGTKQIEENKINTFLAREWRLQSGKSVRVCHSFSSLIDLFPDKHITKKEIKSIKQDVVNLASLTKQLSYVVSGPPATTYVSPTLDPLGIRGVSIGNYPISASIVDRLDDGLVIGAKDYILGHSGAMNGVARLGDISNLNIYQGVAGALQQDINCSSCGKRLGTLPLGSHLSSSYVLCSDCSKRTTLN